MKKTRFERAFPNYKKNEKWFSWLALILWTLFFSSFGAIGYLVYKGNRKQYNKD